MLAEWTAECAEDAPTLVVPWSDPSSGLHFVNLRVDPYDIAEISEAERFPALGRALRALNASRSPVLTAKCDAWSFGGGHSADEDDQASLAALRLELDLDATAAAAGFAGYIDLLWRDRALFASAHQQQDCLDRIVRRAQRLDHPHSKLACTLRPALYDPSAGSATLEGFAVTLYIFALGADDASALRFWELALEDTVHLLRSREFEVARGFATIDPA